MTLSEKINARVTPELKEALAERATKDDRSESYIIGEALKAYLLGKPKAR